ncbi:hypothetical protein ACQ4PT_042427 [Festuca glaucescens]
MISATIPSKRKRIPKQFFEAPAAAAAPPAAAPPAAKKGGRMKTKAAGPRGAPQSKVKTKAVSRIGLAPPPSSKAMAPPPSVPSDATPAPPPPTMDVDKVFDVESTTSYMDMLNESTVDLDAGIDAFDGEGNVEEIDDEEEDEGRSGTAPPVGTWAGTCRAGRGTRSTTAGAATRTGTTTGSASPTAASASAATPSAAAMARSTWSPTRATTTPSPPKRGTLRHAVVRDEPLWIIFKRDMVITLKQELIMNSFKTIDGRGANVHIANGACLTLQFINNVIIHGLHIHDCRPTGNAMVRSSPRHYGWRTMADGDAVSIYASSHVWVDHCSLSNCADGLIDAIEGSTAITVSNNYFTHHNECNIPVTKRIEATQTTWNAWNWRSEGDLLLNGAYFIPSGAGASASYSRASSLGAKSSSMVGTITSSAGVLSCRKGSSC